MMGKKELAALVDDTFELQGLRRLFFWQMLSTTGYRYSAGLSISIGDMVVPEGKTHLLDPRMRSEAHQKSSTRKVY